MNNTLYNFVHTQVGTFIAREGSEERDPTNGQLLGLALSAADFWDAPGIDSTDFLMEVGEGKVTFGRRNQVVWTPADGFQLVQAFMPGFAEHFRKTMEKP